MKKPAAKTPHIPVTEKNPNKCDPLSCSFDHPTQKDPQIRHGDHTDFIFEGRLHHFHDNDHCDDHGPYESGQG